MFSFELPGRTFNDGVHVYLPLAIAIGALIDLSVARTGPLRRAGLLLLTLLTLTMYLKGFVRTHNIHVIQSGHPGDRALFFALIARIRSRIAALVLGFAVVFPLIVHPAGTVIGRLRNNVATMRSVHSQMGLRLAISHLCAPQPGLERGALFHTAAE